MQTKTTGDAAKHVEIDGLRIRYETAGQGPPVLILHGWGGSLESVRPVLAAVAPVASGWAVDLPGFGQSDVPPGAWGTHEYAEFVRALMDVLGLQAAAVLGHSFGGRVAIRLAVNHPERVAKLILVNSAGIRPKRKPKYYARLALAKIGKAAERVGGPAGARFRARILQRTASADYLSAGALRDTFVRVVNEDLREQLPRIAVPTLLIWGGEDRDTPLRDGKLMETLIPDAGLVVFERAGHYSYVDAAPAFGRVVRHFLSPNGGAR
jgi:pimeloyl-ACP methyl ester carboxylesterase